MDFYLALIQEAHIVIMFYIIYETKINIMYQTCCKQCLIYVVGV